MTLLVEICLRWNATTWLRTPTGPQVRHDKPPGGENAHLRHDLICLSVLPRTAAPSNGAEIATLVAVEAIDAVLATLVQVHRARVRDREHARVVDGADRVQTVVELEEPALDRRSAPQPDVDAAVSGHPTSTCGHWG